MAGEPAESAPGVADGVVANIKGDTDQVGYIEAVHIERKLSLAGSLVALAAIVLTLAAVLPWHVFDAYTSEFDRTIANQCNACS